jgi:hypothetical protein
MMVTPILPDPRIVATFVPLFVAAVALAIGLVLRRVVDRFLKEGDPRRELIAQALLYGGTFVVVAGSLWLRHRG